MTTAKHILLVDDDHALVELLSEQLELRGEFSVVGTGTGIQGLERARSDHFDVIILDLGLPDLDGREVCRRMRGEGVKAPIIMLTGSDSDADTVTGLEAGANDYVTKPFKLAVLFARIRAHIRQHERSDDAVLMIGPYIFQPANKLLIDGDARKIRLTDKETAILKYLYRAGNRVIGRDTLLGEVWGYNAGVTTHTLETHVYRLRQKIEQDPSNTHLLVTEPGGYRLNV